MTLDLPLVARAAPRQPRPWVDRAARGLLLSRLAPLGGGSLLLVEGRERLSLGAPGGAPAIRVDVHDPRVWRDVALGGSVAMGEAFMAGRWTTDDLSGLTRLLARNVGVLDAIDGGPLGLARRAAGGFATALRGSTREGRRRDIAHHYDLTPELFRLFLDASMTYSSAYFARDDASLEDAQLAKIERACDKLDLGPGDHLLEIGAGWGAFAVHAARTRGCRVTTTTISAEQRKVARDRVRAAGLEGRVDVQQRDYRDLAGRFDKLVSIEMIEAVGDAHMGRFFRACADRLAPDGLALFQAITIADQHHDRHRAGVDFIKKHIFPGSSIPSITSMTAAATRASDLRLVDLEDMTPHYARTLQVWRERFLARAADVERLGFDATFRRMWEYYLAYCEGGFAERYLGCVQAVFAKPGSRGAARRRRP